MEEKMKVIFLKPMSAYLRETTQPREGWKGGTGEER